MDLVATTDTGRAADDDLTNLDNGATDRALEFVVRGVENGSVVQVFADGTWVGDTIADGDTVTIRTTGASKLADGLHAIRATQTPESYEIESGPSVALTITVDTTPPAGFDSSPPSEARFGELWTTTRTAQTKACRA
ncbi:MAG: hypothetical protein A2W31_05545 [Planctomycetes bacterium RBG_16_64_10]|nr:MAG: hypothetical protein A2W31_05545 [Planctomycetes bacterium RBG_16_64_10]